MAGSKKESAGVILWRVRDGTPEVMIVHPGGPLWARKDAGAWSIAKGLIEPGDDALSTAKRELQEETGCTATGDFVAIGSVQLKSGKTIHGFALRADFDLTQFRSGNFEMEWPAGSGKMQSFPEVDRAEWFPLEEAKKRLNPAQAAFVDAVAKLAG